MFASSTAHAQQPTTPSAPAPVYQPQQPQQAAPAQPSAAPAGQAAVYASPPANNAFYGPAEISSYEEGAPIPVGYHPVNRTRTGLIVAGAVTFGSMYFITALVAAGNADAHSGGTNPAAALWIPGAGPFIQMTRTDSSTAGVFLAVDGIAQVGGLAMLVVGLTSPRTVLVRNDLGKVEITPIPIVSKDVMGAGVVGTF